MRYQSEAHGCLYVVAALVMMTLTLIAAFVVVGFTIALTFKVIEAVLAW